MLRRASPLHLLKRQLLRGSGARRNCSGAAPPKQPLPKEEELDKEAIAAGVRVLCAGATVGAVTCVTAGVIRDTDDPDQCLSRFYTDRNYSMCATGGAIAGAAVSMIGSASMPLGSLAAAYFVIEWLDGFPALLRKVHAMRHGAPKKSTE